MIGWSEKYRIRSYFASSLWIVPFVAIPAELLTNRLLRSLDGRLGWTLLGLTKEGAQALFQTTVTATLSFVVFTFGSLLIAVQIAGGQLTPRIIATTLLRDGFVKYIVGLFSFTLFFGISALNQTDKEPEQLVVLVAACLGVLCFAAFFYLIDYAARMLRPGSILDRLRITGITVIDNVYPNNSVNAPPARVDDLLLSDPRRVVTHERASGVVIAVNVAALVTVAESAKGMIEFVPRVGELVARGEPLFKLYDGAGTIEDSVLNDSVVFGSERTLEQDPTFAFRIIIDIALRALSPAINDPTTAVLAIDQLHRMLRRVGQRHLHSDAVLNQQGELRLYFRTPNWEDFVELAFSEIGSCGSGQLQIVRRLRAMIDNLLETLPDHRHLALLHQRTLLDRMIEAQFPDLELQALARVADAQGLGGASISSNRAQLRVLP